MNALSCLFPRTPTHQYICVPVRVYLRLCASVYVCRRAYMSLPARPCCLFKRRKNIPNLKMKLDPLTFLPALSKVKDKSSQPIASQDRASQREVNASQFKILQTNPTASLAKMPNQGNASPRQSKPKQTTSKSSKPKKAKTSQPKPKQTNPSQSKSKQANFEH